MGTDAVTTRNIVRSLAVVVLVIVIQGTLGLDINFSGIHPDIVVGLTLAAGLSGGPEVGMVTGFVAGMAIDLVSPTPLGLSALVLCLLGFGAGSLTPRLAKGMWWFRTLVMLGGSVLGVLAYGLIGGLIGEPQFLHVNLAGIVIVVALTNVVVAGGLLRMERWALRMRTASPGLVSTAGDR